MSDNCELIGRKCVAFDYEEGTVRVGIVDSLEGNYRYRVCSSLGNKEDCSVFSDHHVFLSFSFRHYPAKVEIINGKYKGKIGTILEFPCNSCTEHPEQYRITFLEGREQHSAWFHAWELRKYEEEEFEEISLDDPKFERRLCEELEQRRIEACDSYEDMPEYEYGEDAEEFHNQRIHFLLGWSKLETALREHWNINV